MWVERVDNKIDATILFYCIMCAVTLVFLRVLQGYSCLGRRFKSDSAMRPFRSSKVVQLDVFVTATYNFVDAPVYLFHSYTACLFIAFDPS